MTEKSESHQKGATGSREDMAVVRQAFAATEEESFSKTGMLMEQVVERENLKLALKRVRANKGAPGMDAMTIDDLAGYLKAHWIEIRDELFSGRYEPQAVRAVDIPKPAGGTRRLGIPTVLDRFIQQAILQVLTPLIDHTFSKASYGYRPKCSAQDAVQAGRKHVEAGYRWVVDLDLEKFFDRVNHDILMSRMARRIKDKRLLKLLRRFLEAGMRVDGVVQEHGEGTPQGGPLSPLQSNVLLDDLDKELERRGHRHCRYADDCNVYVRSKAAGERVMASLEMFLWKRLKLKVNRTKSVVDRPWKRKFLGYSMTMDYKPKLKVAASSVKRAKVRLKVLFREGRGRRLSRVIEEVNTFTRGWVSYYRLSQTRGVFEEMDQWLRRRLRAILWRQWKKPKTRMEKMIQRGLDKERAWESAVNGRGPWWNAGASHMNACVTIQWFRAEGLLNLSDHHAVLASSV